MRILLFILTLLLVGCGQTTSIDSQFAPYIQNFESYYGITVKNIVIKFDTLTLPEIGECDKQVFSTPTIRIDPTYWHSADTSGTAREIVLFHELGHCEFGRMHRTDIIAGTKFAASIMYPEAGMVGESNYVLNRVYYLQELVGRTQPAFNYSDTNDGFGIGALFNINSAKGM